jgi:Leucine-rich repeat (LRR) protein
MMQRSIYGGFGPTPAVSESHVSLNQAVGKPSDAETATSQPALQVKKSRRIQPKSSNSKLYSAASRSPAVKPAPDVSLQSSTEVEEKKTSKSSSALRESIAKAKAARKAAAQKGPQTQPLGAWTETDIQDPFNQQPKDQNHGLLRKRLEAGRTSGHLNIAAMSLTTFPEEVLKMYDFDPNAGTDWYESVDLVKFIAADNDFTELPDAAFPDIDPNQIDLDSEEKGNQFGGLEFLDFHGNLLQSLPLGFRRLQRLHTLNLSKNKLSTKDIQVITEMSSLRDLKLAKNQLEGALPHDIGRLTDLETLDLHENSLTELPATLADLKSLRILNLGHNQFTSLPFEILHKLPLREIIAPKNNIKGTLIPASVRKLDALQTLDVIGNAIVKLSENESLQLPALQTLAISMNRIKDLPDVSSWQELLTLSAEDNSITGLPLGFTDLKKIRNVDLTGNDLSRLDEKIGLMDSLVSFRIANNPLRER